VSFTLIFFSQHDMAGVLVGVRVAVLVAVAEGDAGVSVSV
jgi:hypothetical protein